MRIHLGLFIMNSHMNKKNMEVKKENMNKVGREVVRERERKICNQRGGRGGTRKGD